MSVIPAASASGNLAKSSSCSTNVRSGQNHGGNNLSFRMLAKNNQLFCHTKALRTEFRGSIAVTAQLNEVSLGESSDSFPNSNVVPQTSTPNEQELQSGGNISASNESISEFIAQVTNLVKLVDSKDIVELHLKQLDCEVTIRKKEALSPAPAPAASAFMHSSSPQIAMPSYFPPSPIASTPNSSVSVPIPSSNPVPSPSSLAVKSSKSSFPPLKCPMAGTFYRCPGQGDPPFVKVGDKVKKGQVLCIIEAMKLMNEIEADQSGTVVEILVDDGKPVTVDTPLFLIEP